MGNMFRLCQSIAIDIVGDKINDRFHFVIYCSIRQYRALLCLLTVNDLIVCHPFYASNC